MRSKCQIEESKSLIHQNEPIKGDASKNSQNGAFIRSNALMFFRKSTTDPSDKKPSCPVARNQTI
jgi:hypothetical protein